MRNSTISLLITILLSAFPVRAQIPVFYFGWIKSSLEPNFRPFPPGFISINPAEAFPTDLRPKDPGTLTFFYSDDTIETYPCLVEVNEEIDVSGLDPENHFRRGKAKDAQFWAKVPNYKPARGFRLMRGNILIHERYFQPDFSSAPEIKEEPVKEGLKVWWSKPCVVRYSLDNGTTWEIRNWKMPEHNKILDYYLLIPDSELEKKPVLEFWQSTNLVLTRTLYHVASK